jgi:hypothetical protein
MMKQFALFYEKLFMLVLTVSILMGFAVVAWQIIGLVTLNGKMIDIRKTLQLWATMGTGISALMSFGYIYLGKISRGRKIAKDD